MPTHRQCERTEYRYRNTLIPPNPPTARDIETDGIFTKNAETGINNIVFVNQGDEDGGESTLKCIDISCSVFFIIIIVIIIIYINGGNPPVTNPHHYHYCQNPTMVGF